MSNLFPFDIQNIVIKYAPKEMIRHMKYKPYPWKKLYRILYKNLKIAVVYKYPKNHNIKNKYLNAMLNRLNTSSRLTRLLIRPDIDEYVFINNNSIMFGLLNSAGGPYDECKKIFKSNISQVRGGEFNYFILLDNGKLFGNYPAIPGRDPYIFSQIKINKKVIQIEYKILSNPDAPTLFVLCEDGTLMARGKNTNYELGFGHTNPVDELTEVKIKSDHKIVQVASSSTYTIILLDNGNIMIAGLNIGITAMSGFKWFTYVNIRPIVNKVADVQKISLKSNDKAIQIIYSRHHFYLLFESGLVLSIQENGYIISDCIVIIDKPDSKIFDGPNYFKYAPENWEILNDYKSKVINIKIENNCIVLVRKPKYYMALE